MFEKEILIDGMVCENCTARVKKVLSSLDGIESVDVSLESKKAIIKSNKEIENSIIIETIEDIGFTVKEVR
ncbi:MAG: heavy-metal-associated domain-containing protein [Clostridia bacterium]|nr:heavy-metal-associated domain-containing protein [Clostridia bacterium]